MLREELRDLATWENRHRKLVARLLVVLLFTLLVDAVGSVAVFGFEHGVAGGAIHSYGDALFFTTVQLLTVSSQMPNPFTVGGRIVDVVLEVWAVIVVGGSAGAIASFFMSGDNA